jgi:hypothetical protein
MRTHEEGVRPLGERRLRRHRILQTAAEIAVVTFGDRGSPAVSSPRDPVFYASLERTCINLNVRMKFLLYGKRDDPFGDKFISELGKYDKEYQPVRMLTVSVPEVAHGEGKYL